MLHNKLVIVPINKTRVYVASIGSQILCIARTKTDLINTETRVDVLFIGLKSKVVNIPVSIHY